MRPSTTTTAASAMGGAPVASNNLPQRITRVAAIHASSATGRRTHCRVVPAAMSATAAATCVPELKSFLDDAKAGSPTGGLAGIEPPRTPIALGDDERSEHENLNAHRARRRHEPLIAARDLHSLSTR